METSSRYAFEVCVGTTVTLLAKADVSDTESPVLMDVICTSPWPMTAESQLIAA
jgi:hypothetical protein